MKPRVLHIYKDYWPPVVGGVEKTIHRLCMGLCDEFDPSVLIVNDGSGSIDEEVMGINVRKAACTRRIASAPLSRALIREIGEADADILHYHLPMPTAVIGHLMKKPKGKVVVTWHSDIVRQWWALWAYGPFLRRFLKHHVDVVMPTSPNYIESSKWLRAVREKCEPVPLGIEPEPYAITEEEEHEIMRVKRRWAGKPVILFVGQFRAYKGLLFLIEAMRSVDATCLLVGDGPLRPKVEEMVAQYDLRDRVQLLGRLSDQDLMHHLHACDLLCLPSHLRSEAFGLVQIEAMLCGKPVVSCALASGVPYVNKNQHSGLLAEPGDVPSLVAALNRLVEDADLRQRLGAQGRERALQEFTATRMCGRVADVYRRVLGVAGETSNE